MRTIISASAIAVLLATVVPGRRSLVKAQSLAALPTCAQPAILAAIQASGCQITDKKCFCSNPALIPSLTSAVREACSAADQAALAAFASTYCGTNLGAALTSSPSLAATTSTTTIPSDSSSGTTIPTATSSSISLPSASMPTTGNMTMNATTSGMHSPTMTMSATSSIEWPTNVTTGGAAVVVRETGLAVAALAVAGGVVGVVFEEF